MSYLSAGGVREVVCTLHLERHVSFNQENCLAKTVQCNWLSLSQEETLYPNSMPKPDWDTGEQFMKVQKVLGYCD